MRHLRQWEREAAFRDRARALRDYGPELVPCCRVMDGDTGRLGTLLRIEEGQDSRGEPERRAFVELDGDRPDRMGVMLASYIAPDRLTRVPDEWPGPLWGDLPRPLVGTVPFGAGIVRLFWHHGERRRWSWLLPNHPERGLASFCYEYDCLYDLLRGWAIRRGEPGRDETGWFFRFDLPLVDRVKAG